MASTSRVPSPAPTLTPRTSMTGLTDVSQAAPAPDLEGIQTLLGTMREMMLAVGSSFDKLGEHTARVAKIGPAIDTAHQIDALRRQLKRQDTHQEERVREIEVLIKDVLPQIAEHMSGAISTMVKDGIARRVEARVAQELTKKVPEQLKEQIDEHKKQLDDVRLQLYNSEARRANALMRSNHLTEPLHPLLTPSGEKSALFPKDLATLFALPHGTARALLREFGLPIKEGEETPPASATSPTRPSVGRGAARRSRSREESGETRERMLNRFMTHIGVAFHMVPAPSLPNSTTYPLIAQP